MAKNFEIIINLDQPVIMADGTSKQWTIDDAIEICEKHNCQYICAPHVPDENSSFNHWHLGIHTSSDNTYETIAKWFSLPVNAVNKIYKRFTSTYALYLIHHNHPGKTPVDPDKVISNFALDYDKLIKNVNTANRLEEILSGIDNGTIKEYNYTDHISLTEYSKYERQIKRAWDYRKARLKGIERNMECIFINGDSGTGKTTFAKKICKDRGFDFYVSSGSNDVLDDYAGEPAIILDDLRPSCLSLSDLLKMLDNNTASSVKSRFKNKVLECKLIVITTTLQIDSFFSQVFESETETKVQLMRRCGTYITMTQDKIIMRVYNPAKRKYDTLGELPNMILAQFKVEDMTIEEKKNLLVKTLGAGSEILDQLKDVVNDNEFVPADDIPF